MFKLSFEYNLYPNHQVGVKTWEAYLDHTLKFMKIDEEILDSKVELKLRMNPHIHTLDWGVWDEFKFNMRSQLNPNLNPWVLGLRVFLGVWL